MSASRWRKRGWFGKLLLGAALELGSLSSPLFAEEPPGEPPLAAAVSASSQQVAPASAEPISALPATTFSSAGIPDCDPLAPDWCDPISRVPNFLGDFFARGSQAFRTTLSTQTLHFTGAGAEGNNGNSFVIKAPLTVNGPGGPYTLNQSIPYTVSNTFTLPQNAELSPQVQANFPGASFLNGGGTDPGRGTLSFFYNYLFTSGQTVAVNLPNPSGGGLVGRNSYFDNGSPLPQDRVYFFYNHVGDYRGLGQSFDINRYVLGGEKTFLDHRFSVEVRIPFAGTANSDQVAGQGLAVDHAEFGNVGLAVKGAVYRSCNLVVSAGLGVSLPTADDSRLIVGGVPVVAIQNRACLLQPLLGVAWAPNERFYAQLGMQFDIDPSGNPVQALNADGFMTRIGVLNDQGYAFVSGAAGYWIYQNCDAFLSGVALQGELHFNRSVGTLDSVQDGAVNVADRGSNINVLTATTGAIFQFGGASNFSVGVSVPIGGDRLYDWNAIAQLNYRFGPRK